VGKMKRLTERDEYGNADIIDVDNIAFQCNLYFEELNKVTDALNKLADYEDTGLSPEDCAEYKKFEDEIIKSGKTFQRIIELIQADREGDLK
jgi:hypothetical protein